MNGDDVGNGRPTIKLHDVIEAHPDAREAGAPLLFDSDGSLIQCDIDELAVEPNHPHPLKQFYEDYRASLLKGGASVFTPYGASAFVLNSPLLQKIFQSRDVLDRFPAFKLAGARSSYCLDPKAQTIGILTAGGNAPGLNTVIDSIVKRHFLLATVGNQAGSSSGLTIWGYVGGYVGLDKNDKIKLDVHLTDRTSLQAGSLLKVLRGEMPKEAANLSKEQSQDQIARTMAEAVKRDKLDILYVVGGNGTITAADQMCRHLKGVCGSHGLPVRVVAAPKTMDNDVHFTDVTFGFRSTVENAVEVIKRIHLEAETCGRIAIVELFGAGSGFVALHAAYGSGEVDYVLIPEMLPEDPKQEPEKVATQLDKAAERLAARFRKKGHAILVVAEGATNHGRWGHGGHDSKQAAFEVLVGNIRTRLRSHFPNSPEPQIFTSQPRHLIRSTPPNSFDIDLCKQTGKLMVDTALAGMSRCVVSLWKNQFVLVPMKLATTTSKCVDVGSYYFLSMMEKYVLSS